MIDRPILFSPSMVSALLAGTKTQTRRAIKPPKAVDAEHWAMDCARYLTPEGDRFGVIHWPGDHCEKVLIPCPYGQPGDRLWARETCWLDRQVLQAIGSRRAFFAGGAVRFDNGADGQAPGHPDSHTAETLRLTASLKPTPSIHMPRWASRLTLTVTNIRVQRLQEISAEDAIAEGLKWVVPGKWSVDSASVPVISSDPRDAYFQLWDHINGEGAAAVNPWIWAVTFSVANRNIDRADHG